MRGDQRFQPQPIHQVLHHLLVGHRDAGSGEPRLIAQRCAQHVEPFPERGITPVAQAGTLLGRGEHLLRLQPQRRAVGRQAVPDRLRRSGIDGIGQVGEPDVGRARTHSVFPVIPVRPVTSDTSTTRQVGRAGVASGRNQRNQINPRARPAVDTQLGWPGSLSQITIRQDPSG